jgi:hypothetical protein
MQEEINRLQASLKQLKEGGVPVRIVYAKSDGSIDRASSLDTEEKLLFDELQKELMELKRFMRQQDNDLSRKVTNFAFVTNPNVCWRCIVFLAATLFPIFLL